MVRKRIPLESGVGAAYETLWRLQRAGQRFRHLPLIFDCYKTSVELVVVCEHVPGETLLAYAQRRFAALTAGDPAGFARAVFPGLCDAVSELHDATLPPLVHRDLKPQNVIVASRGLFLIDLGIARQVRAGADHDTVHLGTRAYAPPEQYGFGQTDVRSDVYALGRLLEFCMTGAEPTRRRGAGELAPVMGEGLARVMARATALDPAARYASARELRAAFLHEAGVPGAGGAARLVSGGDGVASNRCGGSGRVGGSAAAARVLGPTAAIFGVRADDAPGFSGSVASIRRSRVGISSGIIRFACSRFPWPAVCVRGSCAGGLPGAVRPCFQRPAARSRASLAALSPPRLRAAAP